MNPTAMVGDIKIIALNDLVEKQSLMEFFPSVSNEDARKYEALYPNRIAQRLLDPWVFFCFLIQDHGKNILVDAGVGGGLADHKTFAPEWEGHLLDRLAEEGIAPEEIDVLVFTHVHPDHVGWATTWKDGAFRKTFPNARYIVQQTDIIAALEGDLRKAFQAGCLEVCVEPLYVNGEFELIDTEELQLTDAVLLKRMPGHTPGAMCIIVESSGERAFFVGDIAANPLEVTDPDQRFAFDYNVQDALRMRKNLLEHMAEPGNLFGACHFGLGRLEKTDDQWYWREII